MAEDSLKVWRKISLSVNIVIQIGVSFKYEKFGRSFFIMFKYEQNETMRLLGYQMWVDEEAREQINDVLSAHEKDFDLISFAVDMFNLGTINGIRRERSRK